MEASPALVKIGVVFLGAGAGGVLRYWLGALAQGWFRSAAPSWGSFPVGTIFVNVTGCLAIGILAALFAGPVLVREEVRLALIVGLLGGYTTFSAFGRETLWLIQRGEWAMAGLNVVISNVAGFLAVLLGHAMVTRVFAQNVP